MHRQTKSHVATHWNLKGKHHYKSCPLIRFLSILLPLSLSSSPHLCLCSEKKATKDFQCDFQWWCHVKLLAFQQLRLNECDTLKRHEKKRKKRKKITDALTYITLPCRGVLGGERKYSPHRPESKLLFYLFPHTFPSGAVS